MIRLSSRVAPRIGKPHIARERGSWVALRQARRLGDCDKIAVNVGDGPFPLFVLQWACAALHRRAAFFGD